MLKIHQTARRFVRHQFEMIGLALDDAAERDHAVIGRALGLARRRAQWRWPPALRARPARRCGRRRAGLVEHARRAREQRVGDMLVKARFHDQHAQRVALFRSARLLGHVFRFLVEPRPSKRARGRTRVLFRFHQPRGVAGHGVDFEIDVVALPQGAEGRHGKRVRDDQHREGIAVHRVNRERDAVERDRALGRDEARKFARRAQRKARHIGHSPRARRHWRARRHGRRPDGRRVRRPI